MAHADSDTAGNGRIYWMTWGVLLIITMIMLLIDSAQVSRSILLAVLLGAMAIKAALIAGNFMHLRHEHAGIIVTVVAGLLVMGLILYGLIAADAARIHQMLQRP
jgi:cytochrome c oxidase subunit IV